MRMWSYKKKETKHCWSAILLVQGVLNTIFDIVRICC